VVINTDIVDVISAGTAYNNLRLNWRYTEESLDLSRFEKWYSHNEKLYDRFKKRCDAVNIDIKDAVFQRHVKQFVTARFSSLADTALIRICSSIPISMLSTSRKPKRSGLPWTAVPI